MPTKYKKLKLADGSTIDEHRFVWEQYYGIIPKGMVVHHKNEDARDNRIENLELMTLSAHTSLHRKLHPLPYREQVWEHGTSTGYDYYKCRCDLCRKAKSARVYKGRHNGWHR